MTKPQFVSNYPIMKRVNWEIWIFEVWRSWVCRMTENSSWVCQITNGRMCVKWHSAGVAKLWHGTELWTMTQSKASVSYSALCAQECKEIVKMFRIVMWLVVTDDAMGWNKGRCKKQSRMIQGLLKSSKLRILQTILCCSIKLNSTCLLTGQPPAL